MTSLRTLKSLEILLESFLDRALAQKEERFTVLDGINRLDDITRATHNGDDTAEPVGNWLAEHNRWLAEDRLKPGDIDRISNMLGKISRTLESGDGSTAQTDKIGSEIEDWQKVARTVRPKLTLKRRPESAGDSSSDSIALFDNTLERLSGLFRDLSHSKQHLLSVLDGALESAHLQKSTDALLLSAFMIYYLKQGGYKVEPYVKRLKEAEKLLKEAKRDA